VHGVTELLCTFACCLPAPAQLALVVRSKGLLPAAPAGTAVTWVEPGRRGYYSQQQGGSVATAQRARSLGRRAAGDLPRTRSSGAGMAAAAAAAAPAAAAAGGGGSGEEGADDPEQAKRRKKQRSMLAQLDDKPRGRVRGTAAAAAAAAATARATPASAEGAAAAAEAGAGTASAGGAAAAATAGAAAGAAVEHTWFECDLCKKWRRMPPNHPVRVLPQSSVPKASHAPTLQTPCCHAQPPPLLLRLFASLCPQLSLLTAARHASLQVPTVGEWVCSMNPAEEWRLQGCGAPQEEAVQGSVLGSFPG
jgi:hypothetical protein